MLTVAKFAHFLKINLKIYRNSTKDEKYCEILLEMTHSWCLKLFLPVDTLHLALKQPEIFYILVLAYHYDLN